MTKFLNDDWMLENGFSTREEYDSKYFTTEKELQIYGVKNSISELGLNETPAVKFSSTVSDVLTLMEENKTECLPVLQDDSTIGGIITQRAITNFLTSFKIELDGQISKAVAKDFKILKSTESIKYLSKSFNRHQYIVIQDEGKKLYVCENKHLLNHFTKNKK